jgi:hypothetical protein
MVAKLFAKHIKLKEAIETVSNTRMGIGVGTPQRLIDLINDGKVMKISITSCHTEFSSFRRAVNEGAGTHCY